MDVTCDRCGTDYEFEETLVSTRGTTVKCTQCGHLFKVYKPASPVDAAATNKHPWTVRQVDGSIHRLASLADLTRLIGEAAFSREDEVSRTGKAWKRLGDIDELKGFFRDRGRQERETSRDLPRDSDAPRQRRSTLAPDLGLRTSHAPSESAQLPRGVGSWPPPPRASAAAPPPSAASATAPPQVPATLLTPSQALAAAPPSQTSASAQATNPAAAAAPSTRFETMGGQVELDARGVVRGVAQLRTSKAPTQPARAAVDLDTATTSRRRAMTGDLPAAVEPATRNERRRREDSSRSYAWLWATLILLGSGAAATYLLWPMLQERLRQPPPQDPTAEFVARADAAFATHRVQHFEDATTEYVKALAFHESDPHILSSLSRVYAVWCQETRFKKLALEQNVRAKKDVEQHSELMGLEKEVRQLAEQAKRYGESAARKNPGNEEAEIALSDALRLNGNLVAARSELDRARSTQSVPNGETLRVAALLAIDEAGGDLRAGTKLASLAVAQEPDLIRARLLLARCLIADHDLPGARYQLSAVETRDRSHPGVLAVQQAIERAEAPEPAQNATPDAGAPHADTSEPDPDAPMESLTHDGLVLRGQKLLEHGQVNDAKRMFEQALFTKPSSGTAHTGLGFVALEKGRPQLAVEHFLPAARAGNLEALIGLGDAYRRLGRPRDALKSYQSYLNRDPGGARSNIARSQVERLTDELAGSP